MPTERTVPFVEVLWKDAWANPTNEITLEDAHKSNEAVEYVTRGWLLKDNEAGVLLAPEMNLMEYETYRGPMHIPRGMVQRVTELTVRRKVVKAKAPLPPSHDGAPSPVMHDHTNKDQPS